MIEKEAPPGGSSYVIASGRPALDRLALLARLFWPTTEALLAERGVLAGAPLAFLDVGCGAGAVALAVAARTGGRVVGLDLNGEVVAAARAAAEGRDLEVRFEAGEVSQLRGAPFGVFDVVYCRCLLSHPPDPDAALRGMIASLRPGGQLIVEDVQVSAVQSRAKEPALQRHVKLYVAAARARGASPELGPELEGRLRRVGLEHTASRSEQPWLTRREELLIHRETMEAIRAAVVGAGLCTDAEVDRLVARLDAWAGEAGVAATLPRIHQAWGFRPA